MAQDVILYTNPMSRGRIARWMLEEIGCPYKAEIVDYGSAMRTPEYLAVNPLGKVPAIRHGEQIVSECAAICAYLADAFPEAGLAPPSAERGSYYRALFFAAGPIEAATTNHHFGFEPEGEQNQGMSGYGSFTRMLDALEKIVPAEGYVAGERFSAADLYLGAHIGWGLQYGSLEERPGFAAYAARVRDRDAYRRAQALDEALLPKEAG
ncbi:glutathione S-transferase family protein [Pelagibius marinus]|uniref:glutathione S-transferase family protein n=1 Tax=Pelagibius marinus TaxID=2762760 RepID=UPI0018727032|nr:glutathione S-transferase family protein [Pelagibius marinus]